MTKRKAPESRLPPGRPPTRKFVQVGQRIGRGVVIDADVRIPRPTQPGRKSGERGARLVCECGNEYVQSIGCLFRGRGARGCGCGLREPKWPDMPNRAARNGVLGVYQYAAHRRGFAWDLTDEDFDRLTALDCYYCGSPPGAVRKSDPRSMYKDGDFIYTGLDRKDNDLGYTLENVVPCCWFCNHAKSSMPFDVFMEWIARLTAYHWFRPELTPSRRLKAVM